MEDTEGKAKVMEGTCFNSKVIMIFYANWEVIKEVVIIERMWGLPRYGEDVRRSLITVTGDADISSLLN